MKNYLFVVLAFTAGISVNVLAAAPQTENKAPPSVGGNEFNQKSGETKEDPPEPKRPVIVGGTRGASPESIADEFAQPTRSSADYYSQLDPAFSKHIDLSLLTAAVTGPDASALADVALGLAEGERALARTHYSGLTAEGMMARVVKLAGRINDTVTLERITSAATTANKPQWAKLVAEAKEFGGISRDGPMVPINKIDAGAMSLLEDVRRACDEAELTVQKNRLEDLKKLVAESGVDPNIKAHANELLDASLKGIPDKPDATVLLLEEFVAESRQYGPRHPSPWPKTPPRGFPSARPSTAIYPPGQLQVGTSKGKAPSVSTPPIRPTGKPKITPPGQLQVGTSKGKAPSVSTPPIRPIGKPKVTPLGQLQIDGFGGRSRDSTEVGDSNHDVVDPSAAVVDPSAAVVDPSAAVVDPSDFGGTSRGPADKYNETDPAFARFVDLSLLTDATGNADPSVLTDVALGLAEGERVLARAHNHAPLSAEVLVAKAVKLATSTGNKAVLDRLTKAAATLNRPNWAKLVADAKEFAGPSRDGPMVALGKIDAEAVRLLEAVPTACEIAGLTGQKAELEALKTEVVASAADADVKAYLTRGSTGA